MRPSGCRRAHGQLVARPLRQVLVDQVAGNLLRDPFHHRDGVLFRSVAGVVALAVNPFHDDELVQDSGAGDDPLAVVLLSADLDRERIGSLSSTGSESPDLAALLRLTSGVGVNRWIAVSTVRRVHDSLAMDFRELKGKS